MRRVSENPIDGSVTYELSGGRYIKFDGRMIREHGIAELLRHAGLADEIPSGRVDVMQRGKKIGTVPATFEPMSIKSSSLLYEPRGGDFVRKGDAWVADKMLGPGDLEAVPGFVWDRQ